MSFFHNAQACLFSYMFTTAHYPTFFMSEKNVLPKKKKVPKPQPNLQTKIQRYLPFSISKCLQMPLKL